MPCIPLFMRSSMAFSQLISGGLLTQGRVDHVFKGKRRCASWPRQKPRESCGTP
jgi:hypothetical protein